MQPIRTAAEVALDFAVLTGNVPRFIAIAVDANRMAKLGMKVSMICHELGEDHKTVRRALALNVMTRPEVVGDVEPEPQKARSLGTRPNVKAVVDRIIEVVVGSGTEGITYPLICSAIGLPARNVRYPADVAVRSGRIRRTGGFRAARYFVGSDAIHEEATGQHDRREGWEPQHTRLAIQARQLYAEGMSKHGIAKTLGIARRTVRRALGDVVPHERIPAKQRRLGPEIHQMYVEGMTRTAIAKALGTTRITVRRVLGTARESRRERLAGKVREMRAAGMTIGAIAKALRLSPASVRQTLVETPSPD